MSLSKLLLWAGGSVFAANFLISLAFQLLEAQPLHFLVVAVALVVGFLGGLYLRNLKQTGIPLLLSALIAALCLGAATLLGVGRARSWALSSARRRSSRRRAPSA